MLVFTGDMAEARGWHRASRGGQRLTKWVARHGGGKGSASGSVPSLVGSSGGHRQVPTDPAARSEGREAENRFS
jgi:hypothetical protein